MVLFVIIKMAEEQEYCGCKLSTWIKTLNLVVGCAMVFFVIFNIFRFLSAGSQIVIAFGFCFYQM